jgi:hypothetical protein
MLPGALRQQHADAGTLQQQQQQHVGLPGSNGLNGWPLDPTSQDQQQQQQQSGPGGDLSGYETPISSGATPEPEGGMEGETQGAWGCHESSSKIVLCIKKLSAVGFCDPRSQLSKACDSAVRAGHHSPTVILTTPQRSHKMG